MRRRSVSALRRRTWRFEWCQRALVSVERVRAAEGDGLVAAGMAEGGAEDDGNVEARETLGNDFLAARGVFARSGEVADDEGLRSVEGAAEEELGQEAVEAIRRLVQVLEQDEGAAELRLERGAAHGGESSEVAASERSFRATSASGAGGPGDRRRELAEEQRLEAVELAGILAELRTHRAVNGGQAGPAPLLVEDGGVAVADEQLLRDGAQVAGEAQDAVAAPGEDQRLGVAAEGVLELALAARIVAGEVVRACEDGIGEAGHQPDLPERADAALEFLALERAGGRDDVDRIARLERLHASSVP